VTDDRQALEAACARLEEVSRLLAEDQTEPDRVKALAEEALALSADITERLPRVLRQAEVESEGGAAP
jgi:hypothetical protein